MTVGRLRQQLQAGHIVVLDGGCGSEVTNRGIDSTLPLWSAGALRSPKGREIVGEIHADYVAAGAEIITTNSFRTQRRTFAKVGAEDEARAATRTACQLARTAARAGSQPVLVAGSVASLEDYENPSRTPPNATLAVEHGEQARLLKKSGVDFILVETMPTIREAVAAGRAACNAGLQVAISFCCDANGRLLSGETIEDAAEAVESLDPLFIAVNCTSPDSATEALRHLRNATTRPLGVYAQGEGLPDPEVPGGAWAWRYHHDDHQEAYVRHAQTWIELGAVVIGGCCGTTPDYIRSLRELADQYNGVTRPTSAYVVA